MNWGDLRYFPFHADVWGDFATWFGAIGTTAAAATAVGYYIFQHWTDKRKQAMLVAVKVTESFKQRGGDDHGRWIMELEINNNSASVIRDVRAELVRKSFYGTVFRGSGTVIYGLLPDLKKEWEEAREEVSVDLASSSVALEPGGHYGNEFDNVRMGSIYRLRLTFVDVNSFSWQITIDNGGQGHRRNKLKEVKYYRGLWERRWEYRRTPRQIIGGWKSSAKLGWWILWHPAKKSRVHD